MHTDIILKNRINTTAFKAQGIVQMYGVIVAGYGIKTDRAHAGFPFDLNGSTHDLPGSPLTLAGIQYPQAMPVSYFLIFQFSLPVHL